MITPEEKVETARVLLNSTVNRWRRERGLHELSGHLTIADAVAALSSMRDLPTRVDYTYADELINALAHWHDPCPLSMYREKNRSMESQRDMSQPGVYIIMEPTPIGDVPRYVEATPSYVGEGKNLGHRLWQHSTGRNSNPAEYVTDDYLERYATDQERAAYHAAYPSQQREIRELCIYRRGLWVKTTHTESKSEAQRLENAVINLYRAKDIKLWNKRLYTTHKAWRAPQ